MPPAIPGRGGAGGRRKPSPSGGQVISTSGKQKNGDTSEQASSTGKVPATRGRGAARGRGRGQGGARASADKQPPGGSDATSDAPTRPTTRRSNQDQHPGERHLRYTTKRRTKEQILQDNLENAAKLLAERKKTIEAHQSQIQSAAAFETTYRADNKSSESAAIRPDLADLEKYVETMAVMTAAHEETEYDSDNLSVPMEDWTQLIDNDAGDPDYMDEGIGERDAQVGENGVPAGVESEDELGGIGIMGYPYHKGSKASNRGVLRGAILKTVDTSATATIDQPEDKSSKGKRKQPSGSEPLDVTTGPGHDKQTQPQKRAKAQLGLGGLRDNWKASAPDVKEYNDPYSHRSAASSTTSFASSAEPQGAGELQEDEDVEILNVVRASKGPVKATPAAPGVQPRQRPMPRPVQGPGPSAHSTGTLAVNKVVARQTKQMGIKIEPNTLAAEVDIDLTGPTFNEESKPKRKEAKYTNASLPFPQDEARQGLKQWQRNVLPLIYDWAGSLPRPFGSNSKQQYLAEIRSAWSTTFPHLSNEQMHPTIDYLAGSALRNWRSEIGKAGLRVVDNYVKGLSANEIERVVTSLLPTSDSVGRFIYAHLDNSAGTRGAWESDLVAEVFAYHMNATNKIVARFWPAGALALSATSVERALTRLKDGDVNNAANPFSDGFWGRTAEQYAESTINISGEKWEAIFTATAKFLPSKTAGVEDEGESEFVANYGRNVRTMITD